MRNIILVLFLLATGVQAAPSLELAQVTRFDGSHVGYAGSASPNYEAFRAVFNQGQQARAIFEKTLQDGTPAAKVYSAIGLYHIDPEAGIKALSALQGDSSDLESLNGCLALRTTVSELATEFLADRRALTAYLPRNK